MRNFIKLGLVFGLVFLVTGCGTTTTKCTRNEDQGASGYIIDYTYDVISSGDTVKKVEIKEIVTSKNNTTIAYFEDIRKEYYKELNKKYKGFSVDTKKEKGKVTITATADFSKIDVKSFANDSESLASDYKKNKKLTTSMMKKYYADLGATCK